MSQTITIPLERRAALREMLCRAGMSAGDADLVLDLSQHAVTEAFRAVETVARRAPEPALTSQVELLAAQLIEAAAQAYIASVLETATEMGITAIRSDPI